jgi:hypothetical protein
MTDDQPDTQRGDDELEVTDLLPPRVRVGGHTRLPRLSTRAWLRVLLGLSLLLLVTVSAGAVSVGG